MVEFRRDPDGTLWSYEEGVRIAQVVEEEDILAERPEECSEGRQPAEPEPDAPQGK